MKLYKSLLIRFVVSIAIAEATVMALFVCVRPINVFVSEYVFLGAVSDIIILTLIVAALYFWFLKKPLDVFVDAAVAQGKGDLSRRVDAKMVGEFGMLAIAFNEMAENLQNNAINLEKQVLERTERLSKIQRGTLNILEDLHESKVALERSRESFVNIVVKSVDGILVVSRDGLIRFASPSAAQMIGTEIEKMVGTDFGLQVREGQVSEIRIVRVNGDVGVGEIRSTQTQWEGRDAYLIFVHDITGRKQSEKAIEESEKYFRSIIETATDGILVADLVNKKFRMANHAISQLLGYSQEELVKMGVPDIHPEKDMPYVSDQIERQIKGEFTLAKNIPLRRKDGTVSYADVNSNVLTFAGKKFLLGFFRDITERKRVEEADKANIRFLEGLERLDQAIKLDADVEKMLWNAIKAVFLFFDCDRAWLFHPCDPNAPSFRVPVEINRPEYPGANAQGLDVPMTPELAQNLREALASDEPVIYVAGTERPINKVSAEKFGVQSQMFVALYPKLGKPWAFGIHQCSHPRIWTVEEKRLFKEIGRRISDGLSDALFLRELQDSNEKLKKLDKLKTEFISTVSHELRTPLAIIKEGVSLVLDEVVGDVNPEQGKLLGLSKDNVERLANIINDLLDMSKIEAGKVEIKRKRVNMSRLLRDMCDAWNVTIAKKNQFCELVVPVSEVDINVDGEKIMQVLNNLISNALKFAQDGKVIVRLEDKKDAVDVSISNIGVGISAENLPQVFGKFQQFNRPSGSGPHGTGLGLVISKSLVELHGGTITVESDPGKVTCFTFTLPKISEA